MRDTLERVWLVLLTAALMVLAGCNSRLAMAQAVSAGTVATTTVQDTIFRADGTPAGGTVLVSWSAFTTAGGSAVAAGSTAATIGAGGVLTLQLAPNAGSTPMGSYYTAVLHLNDGTTSRQYWVVPVAPAGSSPVRLAAIESDVLPATVAMQTVSKQYVDTAIAAAQAGHPLDQTSVYVLKTGDTMTGPLVLPGDPVSANEAADKNYVDENVAALTAGLGQKVSLLPSATQLVAQPTGTDLSVNLLNGQVYASQYASGSGNNGVANALASSDCAHGCALNVEPTYATTELAPAVGAMARATQVDDLRGGAETRTVLDPMGAGQQASIGESVTQYATLSAPQLQALVPGALGIAVSAKALTTNALTGGSNLFPNNIETVPYFKNTYGVLALQGNYNTQGQHVQLKNEVNCYAVGDCLAGGQFITSSGGYRDNGDEGAHPFDLQIAEDTRVFTGSCASGCTGGTTTLTVTASASAGTQGDGRFLMDTSPAHVLSAGTITGGSVGIFGVASFSGTSFAVSTFLATAQAATSQPGNMAPGTVTLTIATSGVTPGFATSTAALPATSGVACVADNDNLSGATPNFETALYSVVDATHLQLTLNKPHVSGATIAVGGLCGYGIEQKADTRNGIRQVFPVIGSISATSLYYADANQFLVGYHGAGSTSGYLSTSTPVAAIARSGGVVTVTTAANVNDLTGLTLTVSGVADASYNGSFAVSSIAANQFTYASAGANSTSTGGTVSFSNGSYALYPMAEVLSVANPATKLVDGTFTLAANTVPWASGDTVELPHYYKQLTFADTELVTQYMPRPIQYASAGKLYTGLTGAGVRGWQIANGTANNLYLGAGGTYTVPDDAFSVTGPWNNDFEVMAGTGALLRVHCNLYGCNRWDSAYRLFDLDGAVSEDTLTYAPQSSTATWSLGGTSYSFTPQAFQAGTINAATVNATTVTAATLNGAVHATGGTLDGVVIGGSTATTGSFSTVTAQHLTLVPTAAGGLAQNFVPADDSGATKLMYGANHANAAYVWWVNDDGSASFPSYSGPATAPSGACSKNGVWVFSQDGHATFCASGTWSTKL